MALPRDPAAHRRNLRDTRNALDADAYARGLRHWRNDHRNPKRGCWARGYAVGYTGGRWGDCPYVEHANHGGTWGRQAYGAWLDGWREGRKDGQHDKPETERGE